MDLLEGRSMRARDARRCRSLVLGCLLMVATVGCEPQSSVSVARPEVAARDAAKGGTATRENAGNVPSPQKLEAADAPLAAAQQALPTAQPRAALSAPPPAPAAARQRESLAFGRDSAQGLGNLGTIGSGYGGGAGAMRAPSHRAPKAARRSYAMAAGPASAPPIELSAEAYAHVEEDGFAHVKDAPLSTFSIDVDTASYSNVRRMLRADQLPPADAVRIEEMLNYFRYEYPEPEGAEPIAVHTEVTSAPWAPTHRLVHVGLHARELKGDIAPRNLVFLIDVSGSMASADKLPLLRRGLSMLAGDLRAEDHIAIVVYAGSSGLVLPPTSGSERATVLEALHELEAGGSTNGGEGIELAYRVAQKHFVRGGINRVILATDGDFNVGVTSQSALVKLIEDKRKSGVFLTVLGFGSGNLKDSTMEALADKGNGNYAYIDSLDEAHKVLVREAGSTLVTVAKDVKVQVEWNPHHVASYRLIGYENRKLAARDFNDDEKDAGEMGAGHTVTALYDVVLRQGAGEPKSAVDPLRYQDVPEPTAAAHSDELLTVKVRYKRPSAEQSQLLVRAVASESRDVWSASNDMRFAAGVASFGMLLRDSSYKAGTNLALVRKLVRSATAQGAARERLELLELLDAAERLGLGARTRPPHTLLSIAE